MASRSEERLFERHREHTSTTATQVQELVAKARAAQAVYESFSQEQVDAIVKGIGKYVYDNAEMLARMAVDETGIGVYEDKILKNKGKARVIWNNLKDKKSRGIIGEDAENNMVFVAKPMGVVGAVTPVTNPIVTPMCNAMFALKTGNAVIFAPHPKAEKCTRAPDRRIHEGREGEWRSRRPGPEIRNGSVETTQELMKDVDVVVATGGGAMVKSAYSSGKPSYGVGAGNVPVIIDRGVDLKDAAEKIVTGASFDNGIICSHEQFVLTPEEQYDETVKSFIATGKVWFTDDKEQVQKLRDVVFPGGHLNKDVVGRSAREIGAMAGIDVPESARIILLPAEGAGDGRRPGQGEALPGGRHPALQDVRGGGREGEGESAGRGRRPLGGACTRTTKRTSATCRRRAADQPPGREPGVRADRRRLADQRLRADDDARLRLVGRQLDLGESRLQAPDERVADRQGHHEQEGADRRGDLELKGW